VAEKGSGSADIRAVRIPVSPVFHTDFAPTDSQVVWRKGTRTDWGPLTDTGKKDTASEDMPSEDSSVPVVLVRGIGWTGSPTVEGMTLMDNQAARTLDCHNRMDQEREKDSTGTESMGIPSRDTRAGKGSCCQEKQILDLKDTAWTGTRMGCTLVLTGDWRDTRTDRDRMDSESLAEHIHLVVGSC
jgi:hypothetical protein